MFEEEEELTPIGKLGEFGFIDHVTRDFERKNPGVIFGVGDDAAVYEAGKGEVHLISTDLLVEGIHFDLSYVPLKHLGFKSVAVNLSDIFAMNAVPFGITVSVAMSNRFTLEAMDAFYEGVKICCDQFGVDLLGGDTSASEKGLIISITALGKCGKEEVVYRNGANINDLVCVTGDLGAAYAGLQILEREKAVFKLNPEIQPDLSGYQYCIGRQLKPDPRGDLIQRLREMGVKPTSMIDISDGLASELFHICRNSGTGVEIYDEKIPIDYETGKIAEEFGISPTTYALNGGEDYELLFTIRLEDYEKIKDQKGISIIGHINPKSSGLYLVNQNGSVLELKAQGWNHFTQK